jgi:hypothetical protein
MATSPVVYYNRPLDSTAGTTINIDFSSDLTKDFESEVPLLTLLSRLKSKPALTNEFKFAVGRRAPRTSVTTGVTSAGTAGAAATILMSSYTEYFTPGDVIEVSGAGISTPTATYTYQLYVSAVTASTSLTVYPADPTLAVGAIPTGATVRRIAPGMIEGSSGTNSSQTVPTVYSQYCQSFEHYFDVTRIQAQNRQYTEPERSRLREETRQKHALDQEYAYFFSHKVKDTTVIGTGGHPRYQMSGAFEQISSNVLEYGADLSDDELYNFMTKVHSPMYSAGMKRLVLASGTLLADINKLATEAIRITTEDSTWGPNITRVHFAGRIWDFVEAPTLSEARDGWGLVVHPMYMRRRPLIETEYEMNVQVPKSKFYQDGFYTVSAIELRLEEVFGIICPALITT